MKRVTVTEVRRIDQEANDRYGMPSILLMENAGRSVSEAIARISDPCKVAIFSGKGNNGGDGFVIARHLDNRGYLVRVILLADPSKLTGDALTNFEIVRKMEIPVAVLSGASEDEFLRICGDSDLVVDAILGIGLQSSLAGVFEAAIRAINRSGKGVISVDIPSGLDADTGEPHGIAVKATWTVTLALPKAGLYAGEGPRYAGKIETVGIGLPWQLLHPFLEGPRS